MPFYNELGHDKSVLLLKHNKYAIFKMWEYYALIFIAVSLGIASSVFFPTTDKYISAFKGLFLGLLFGTVFGFSFNTLIYHHILKTGQYVPKNDNINE